MGRANKRVDERDGHIVHVEVHVEDVPAFDTILSLLQSREQCMHSQVSQHTEWNAFNPNQAEKSIFGTDNG